jgi:hypothetical protein
MLMDVNEKLLPTCPHCGHVETDVKIPRIVFDLEGDALLKCDDCNVTYLLTRNIRVTYSSVRMSGFENLTPTKPSV